MRNTKEKLFKDSLKKQQINMTRSRYLSFLNLRYKGIKSIPAYKFLKYCGLTFIFHTDMVISGIGSAIRTLLIIQGYLRHRKKHNLEPKALIQFVIQRTIFIFHL